MSNFDSIPVVDLSPVTAKAPSTEDWLKVSAAIGDAVKRVGFFYVINHGMDQALVDRLFECVIIRPIPSNIPHVFRQGYAFFDLPEQDKMEISMSKGGRAIRGYFPVFDCG